MAEMGNYCKAYHVKDLKAFPGWEPNLDNLNQETDEDSDGAAARTELNDEDILYIQETYIVTDGIFIDEHIVFDQVTDAWKTFCHDELGFEIPDFEAEARAYAEAAAAEESASEN
ncbi:MAG: hypothetical protein AAF772_05765 [Acidobacteriota bacterium]